MLRLLIVDDEPEICELVRSLIDWDKLEMELIGMVQDGVEADRIIQAQVPDIVITDIQMPGYSGLQLIEHAQASATKFIVVSGYREFEYAQTAMRFGVEDYLLKPINRVELNRILHRLEHCYKQVRQKTDEELFLRGTAEEHARNLRKRALQQAIGDAHYSVDEDLFSLGEGIYQFAAVHIDWVQTEDAMKAHEVVLQSIGEQIVQEIDGDCECVIMDATAYVWMCLPKNQDTMMKVSNVMIQIVKEKNIQYAPARITVGLGLEVYAIEDWKWAANTAKQCIRARLVFGNTHVIRYAQVQALPEQPQILFTNADKKYLAADIGLLETSRCVEFIRKWFARIEIHQCRAVCNLHQNAIEIAMFVQQTTDFLGLRGDANAQTLPMELLPMPAAQITCALNNCTTVQGLCHCLCTYISEELFKCAEIKKRRESEPIRIAKQYVVAHIDKQISLEEVASQIHMSAGYFSTLFHKKTGTTFSDYVIGVRMETAKTLLRENKLSVAEVAGHVGYADARHFSKLFQKMIGIKPTVFRKFYE